VLAEPGGMYFMDSEWSGEEQVAFYISALGEQVVKNIAKSVIFSC
jgi:hypothetical protein